MKSFYFIFLLIFPLAACQDEDYEITNNQIIGSWYQDAGNYDSNLSYRNSIIFNVDGTFEASLQLVETGNPNNIIGYMSLTKGEYQITNNTLSRFNIEKYGLDNANPYLNRDELILEASTASITSINLQLNRSRDVLTLIYDCRDRKSMCIPEQTYYRRN